MMTPDLPSPDAVRQMCARRAWDDDVDDDSRLLLEMAADTIRVLHRRLVKLSGLLEREEANTERLTHYVRALASQKGGAA